MGPLRLLSVILLLLPVLFLSACGDDGSGAVSPPVGDPPPLRTVLPESTRAILELEIDALFSGDAAEAVMGLLHGKGADAALNAPFQTIKQFTLGADIAATMERVLLAQTTDVQDGFLLVAKLQVRRLGDLFDRAELSEAAPYEGHTIYADRESDLQLSLLPDGRLLVGREAALHAAIDTLQGEDPGVGAGEIGPFLFALDGAEPFAFLSGLPALYGRVDAQGPGAATLRQAQVVSGALTFGANSFEGRVRIHSDNAAEYVARFNALIAGTGTAPLTVGESGTVDVEIPSSSLEKTPAEVLESRVLLKKLVHAMDAVDYAESVSDGGNVPWMNFDVGGNPNSIFINFEFKGPAEIAAFEASELPEGFVLAPLRILETDEPTYFLVLNIYNSSGGLVAGARAEWSVFVEDPENGHPRFLVVQAAAANVSADSVNLLTSPEPVSHEFEDGGIVSYVGVEDRDGGAERLYFSSRVVWPQDPEARVAFARRFVAANDFIHWGNGVADRTLYNATVHNREGVRIPEAEIEISDNSHWSMYLKPVPKHSYVYLNPLEIVISPWWNLDAEYLDVTADHLQSLVDFKNNFYPAAVLGIAEAAVAGEGDALAGFTVGTAVPSAYFNFVITDPGGLEDALELPENTRLVPLRLLESDGEADYYLSLRVYDVDGMPSGTRAEWTVFVKGDDGRPHALIIDLLTEEVAADPELILRLPSVVEHTLSSNRLRTRLQSGALVFEADIRLGETESALPTLDFVEAGDWVCRRNGSCDKVFYDGQTMEEEGVRAGRDAFELQRVTTPWDVFIGSEPASVFVRENTRTYAWNPWRNVEESE
ncbi:MAG: hypothetical protein P8R42_07465 [Candidatus Binatia bacterium]|nr:hypothetical protein [Candidatus Binatia bacterium]